MGQYLVHNVAVGMSEPTYRIRFFSFLTHGRTKHNAQQRLLCIALTRWYTG